MAASTHRSTVTQVRGSHLIIEALGAELVIYDRITNKAHMLDPRAASIWNATRDGCSVEDLVGLVDGDTVEDRRRLAHLAISELERAGLLQSSVPVRERRQLLKSLGAVAALPMVVSILAPTSAAAASNLGPGVPCIQGMDTCQTPISMVPFLCQDPDGGGPKIGRCCPDQPSRDNTLLDGQPCTVNNNCCSFNCDTGAGKCMGDY
jgi:hypothetical protein